MKVTPKTRLHLRLQHLTFVVLILLASGLVAFLSHRHNFFTDWTYNRQNSLGETSEQLLRALDVSPAFTIYASAAGSARTVITDTVKQYQQILPDIQINYVDPDLEPDMMRDLNISGSYALQVTLKGKSEFIPQLTEQEITNAIQRLARSEDRWLVFIEGHGERRPEGIANHDYGEWVKQLSEKGFRYNELKLAETPVIPENAAAIVIASPQVNYLPGEIETLKNFIARGGNLLWFTEPEATTNLGALAGYLGLEFPAGTVHDQFTLTQRFNDPRFIIVTRHPKLSSNDNFQKTTLFPYAQAIEIRSGDPWQSMPILSSSPQSWIAVTGGTIKIPADKKSFDIGVALVRDVEIPSTDPSIPDSTRTRQRILVLGDGDFISNQYQGNAGNLDLGIRLVNWVMHDDKFIAIPARVGHDIKLEFTRTSKIIIGFGFLLVIPILLAGTGARIWLLRRKR